MLYCWVSEYWCFEEFLVVHLTLQNDSHTFLWNVRNFPSNHAASHPGRLEFSFTLLWKPRNLQIITVHFLGYNYSVVECNCQIWYQIGFMSFAVSFLVAYLVCCICHYQSLFYTCTWFHVDGPFLLLCACCVNTGYSPGGGDRCAPCSCMWMMEKKWCCC